MRSCHQQIKLVAGPRNQINGDQSANTKKAPVFGSGIFSYLTQFDTLRGNRTPQLTLTLSLQVQPAFEE
jgi:hypothetical protein